MGAEPETFLKGREGRFSNIPELKYSRLTARETGVCEALGLGEETFLQGKD